MPCFENIAVIIPSFNPDEKLPAVVKELAARGFSDIIVVNDGSTPDCKQYFEAVALPQCTLLTHPVNRGKGSALKTAFSYVLSHRPDCLGVVTVDGDGQHHPEDVAALACTLRDNPNAVVLGVRDFAQPGVPFKSRLGNRLTALAFRLVCRKKLSDTQTGLRAIGRAQLTALLTLKGERYEYESNMLLFLSKSGVPLREVSIKTIYLAQNASSHYRPFADSFSILRMISAFALSSAGCAALDIGCYWLVVSLFGFLPLRERVLLATLISRGVSSAANYLVNRRAVFGNQSPRARSLTRYYILCVCQLVCSWAGVWGLTLLIGGSSVPAKIIVDTLLFFFSFNIQRVWVFQDTVE